MAAAGPIACPTKTRDYFVSDHQNSMSIAHFPHQWHEGFVRHNHSARALDRLHDKGGNAARPLKLNLVLHRGGDTLGQLSGVGFVKRISIGIG